MSLTEKCSSTVKEEELLEHLVQIMEKTSYKSTPLNYIFINYISNLLLLIVNSSELRSLTSVIEEKVLVQLTSSLAQERLKLLLLILFS